MSVVKKIEITTSNFFVGVFNRVPTKNIVVRRFFDTTPMSDDV